MHLGKEQIRRSIDWLCNNGSPPVKYLTHRYILAVSSDTKEVEDLWTDVQSCDDVLEIFSKQRDDGSWYSGGSWSTKPSYLQKEG